MNLIKAALLFPVLVDGHGNCLYPPAWWDAGGKVGVQVGGECATGCGGKRTDCESFCMWYSNYTMLPEGVNPSIQDDSPLRTYMDFNFRKFFPNATWPNGTLMPDAPIDYLSRHPWRHPGTAPIWSSCGISGGNPKGCGLPPGVRCPDGGDASGPDARYYDFPDVVTTKWKRGQVVEVAWGITANHGGGYQYRICPTSTADQPPGFPLTEECFQMHPLPFVGNTQWLQFGYNRSSRKLFGDLKAVDTNTGTWPEGSTWRRNPIPACKGPGGLRAHDRGGGGQSRFPNKGGAISCSAESFKGGNYEGGLEGPQFDPPGGYPGPYAEQGIYTYGFGNNEGDNTGGPFLFSIVDLVKVPEELPPGKYVLGFRYDCEQTTQVWTSCSDIEILPVTSTEPTEDLIPDTPPDGSDTTTFPLGQHPFATFDNSALSINLNPPHHHSHFDLGVII